MTASAFYVETRSNDTEGNPVPVRYDTSGGPIEFRIATAGMPDGDGSEVAAIQAAFDTWAAVPCVTIDFEMGAREDMPRVNHWQLAGAGIYILVWWSDDVGLFPGPTVGRADWAHDTMGNLIGGQVVLNSRDHAWSTTEEADKFDVQAVVTALVGRLLVINSDMMESATYRRYVPGDISKRTLGPDDIAGVTYLYGDGTCTDDPVPEMLCDGTMPMVCPPPAMLMSDGGMGTLTDGGMGGTDSGPIVPVDGGAGGDAGGMMMGGDDGGCSCSVPGTPARSRLGALAGLVVVIGGVFARARRRYS
jgi:MYXO-CTERM domain-containing protein